MGGQPAGPVSYTHLFNLIVFSLMFNTTVTAIPNYITMAKLGWVDTHLAIIVPAFASALGLYLMKLFHERLHQVQARCVEETGNGWWRRRTGRTPGRSP